MARSLKLRVVAEGVETRAQLDFLRAHQCDAFQGFLFSKPLTALEASAMLRAQAGGASGRTAAG
jgi:EAL domain-containing protein (putative c-di-GMP-specific phosphodiesterase class I)